MTDTHDAVTALLERFADRYSAKDPDGVLALFSGDEAVVVGTGADEVRFGLAAIRAQVERDIAQADTIALHIGDLRVAEAGDAAFAYADATFVGSAGDDVFQLPVRLSVGLVRSAGEWRVMQFHVSVAFGEQESGESFPT